MCFYFNSGSNTYDIVDSDGNVAGAGNPLLATAGTVTVTGTSTVANAVTIAGFAKAVVYSISDSSGNALGAAGAAYNEAVNITITGNLTVANLYFNYCFTVSYQSRNRQNLFSICRSIFQYYMGTHPILN